MRVQRTGARSLNLVRFPDLNSCEELRQSDAQRLSNSDHSGEAEILSSGLQVSEKGPVHLAIVRKRFLGRKTASDADFADALSESFQDVVHAPSVWEWLPDGLPLVH